MHVKHWVHISGEGGLLDFAQESSNLIVERTMKIDKGQKCGVKIDKGQKCG